MHGVLCWPWMAWWNGKFIFVPVGVGQFILMVEHCRARVAQSTHNWASISEVLHKNALFPYEKLHCTEHSSSLSPVNEDLQVVGCCELPSAVGQKPLCHTATRPFRNVAEGRCTTSKECHNDYTAHTVVFPYGLSGAVANQLSHTECT